ncbi:MAG: ABC transporter [Rhodobacteraceae bacterium]|nr:ABC transporter [Paracoccaceae bacterium]
MTQTSTPLVVFEDVRIEAGQASDPKVLAQGISFSLERGKVLGLIGESGAGKSTIGLAALGYLRGGCRVAGGRILLSGQDIVPDLGRKGVLDLRSTRIAYVAQSAAASFNPAYRLIDQCVEMALDRRLMSRAEAEERAHAYFKRFRIADPVEFGRRFPHQVSGGQLQRAMLAMAMLCQPEVIVFDEPTTALDVTTQIEVLATIRDALAEEGLAGIYISHDLALISQIADDIVVLRHGKIVEQGPTGQIVNAPEADYTRNLLDQTPLARQPDRTTRDAPRVDIRDAQGSYGQLKVLKGVDLRIGQAQSVALVGESGSGKSTLARALMGLFPLTSGRIELDGQQIGSLSSRKASVLQKLQLIHQYPDTALNPRQSIRKILTIPLRRFTRLRGAALEARLRELLRQVELPETLIDRYPPALSGGQKQRVCIARALAAEPEILVCDEVTASLDKLTADEITRLLGRLQTEQGLSTLLITHDFSLVRALADEVIVMRRGEVVEAGPMAEVTERPQHPYTRRLIASIPTFEPGWLDAQRVAEA